MAMGIPKPNPPRLSEAEEKWLRGQLKKRRAAKRALREPAKPGSLHPDGSVRRVELPRRITDKWTRERTDAELLWLARDFQGTCNGQRFYAEILRRREALNSVYTPTDSYNEQPDQGKKH